jgi:putative oxidoreductase
VVSLGGIILAKKTTRKTVRTTRVETEEPMMAADHHHDHGECCGGDCGNGCAAWILTVLRVVLGAIFLYHGIPKLLNMSGTMGFFSSIGLPGWLGVIVGVVEVLAGIALVLGAWSRWASYATVVVMAGAIIWVHLVHWSGISGALERDVLILIGLLVIAWHGPGRLAVHGYGCEC